jgi:hypothetical protein
MKAPRVIAAFVVVLAGVLAAAVTADAAPAVTRPIAVTITQPRHRTITVRCHSWRLRRGTLTATRCIPAIRPPARPATTACVRTVTYNGGPYQGGLAVNIVRDTCSNQVKAVEGCVYSQMPELWAAGNVVNAAGDESVAQCPPGSGFLGVGAYGFQWLDGSRWVYVGH